MGQQQSHTVVLHLAPRVARVEKVDSAAMLLKKASEVFALSAEDVVVVGPEGRPIRDDKTLTETFQKYFKDHPHDEEIHLDVAHRDEVSHDHYDPHVEDEEHFNRRENSVSDFEEAQNLEETVPQADVENRVDQLHDSTGANLPKVVDVMMIGAGPVGLWTAINLKLTAPHLSIVMFEKYATYQRKHVILLQQVSMGGRNKTDEKFNAMCKGFPKAVRTNDLEDKLTATAVRLGIHIVIKHVGDIAATVAELQPSVLIGSDGSHSSVRDKFMNQADPAPPEGYKVSFMQNSQKWWSESVDNSSLSMNRQPVPGEQEVLHRTIQLKYELSEPGKKLGNREIYALAKVLPNAFTYFEHIGKTGADGKTPATLVLGGLSAEQLSSVKASFRSPVTLDEGNENFSKMDSQLRQAVKGYLKAKEKMKGEKRVPGSETIAPVSLNIYASKRFGSLQKYQPSEVSSPTKTTDSVVEQKPEKELAVYVIGDAAFAVPFFRALNNGFVAGSRLAKVISEQITSGKAHANFTAVESFHRFMTTLSGSEFALARSKSSGLEVARGFTSVTKHYPRSIQVIKLDDATYEAVKAEMKSVE